MIELNVDFQENYKQLDALCKDIFSSRDGVTEYINEMENTSPRFYRFVSEWDDVYRKLKHLRWLRNQLAHEVGAFDAELCTQSDISWLKNFYNSILKATDPLAKAGQAKRAINENNNFEIKRDNAVEVNTQSKNKKSLWNRIKAGIKKLFS